MAPRNTAWAALQRLAASPRDAQAMATLDDIHQAFATYRRTMMPKASSITAA
jgi:hypothetical protein